MKYKIGDKVRFLDEVGEAVIKKIVNETTVIIEDDSGFDYEYPVKGLMISANRMNEYDAYDTVVPSEREIIDKNIDSSKVLAADKDFKSKYNKLEAVYTKQHDFMEVDLHILELIDSEVGLDATAKLDIQISHFERMLKNAERDRIHRVVFIHGVGQGVLRQKIREMLRMYYPNMTFHDGDYARYGYGATEIRIEKRSM